MKSWVHSTSPSGHILELRDVSTPSPVDDEIIVRVKAASFNRGEIVASQNNPSASDGKPAGIECAGEIVQLGSPDTGFNLGDKVMGRAKYAFSEYAVIQKGDAIRVPSCFSWEEAACASITYQVAYDMLYVEGKLQEGEWLLITGVTSGVGVAALQLGKLIGAKVIGTSRSQEKLAKLSGLGLDYGLVYEEQTFVDRVMDITSDCGVDMVVNNVGGSIFSDCLKVLAYQGRLATVGHLDGVGRAEIDLKTQHIKRLKLFGVSNSLRSARERAQSVASFVHDILPMMDERKIVPSIDRVFEFHECNEALAYMNSNRQLGKVVVLF